MGKWEGMRTFNFGDWELFRDETDVLEVALKEYLENHKDGLEEGRAKAEYLQAHIREFRLNRGGIR